MLDENTRHDTHIAPSPPNKDFFIYRIDGWCGSNAHRSFAVPSIEALRCVVHDEVTASGRGDDNNILVMGRLLLRIETLVRFW